MTPGTIVYVEDSPLLFVEYPLYTEAHPGEPSDAHERCTRCARARRKDTGELVLLWLCEGKNWGVSRHDPNYLKHRTELYPA